MDEFMLRQEGVKLRLSAAHPFGGVDGALVRHCLRLSITAAIMPFIYSFPLPFFFLQHACTCLFCCSFLQQRASATIKT